MINTQPFCESIDALQYSLSSNPETVYAKYPANVEEGNAMRVALIESGYCESGRQVNEHAAGAHEWVKR